MQSTRQHTRDAGRAADPMHDLGGAWRGLLIDSGGHVESFNLQRDSADHRFPGEFQRFTTPSGIVAGARLLEASDRTVVVLL